jgi:hypothetical protein
MIIGEGNVIIGEGNVIIGEGNVIIGAGNVIIGRRLKRTRTDSDRLEPIQADSSARSLGSTSSP